MSGESASSGSWYHIPKIRDFTNLVWKKLQTSRGIALQRLPQRCETRREESPIPTVASVEVAALPIRQHSPLDYFCKFGFLL